MPRAAIGFLSRATSRPLSNNAAIGSSPKPRKLPSHGDPADAGRAQRGIGHPEFKRRLDQEFSWYIWHAQYRMQSNRLTRRPPHMDRKLEIECWRVDIGTHVSRQKLYIGFTRIIESQSDLMCISGNEIPSRIRGQSVGLRIDLSPCLRIGRGVQSLSKVPFSNLAR
jgi:hypothetical protein